MSPRKFFIVAIAMSFFAIDFASPVRAQEPNAEHLAAAKKALAVTKATEGFDFILPKASVNLKNQLSANNHDRADEIDRVVDEEALGLAVRRGVLENEAAKLFATTFKQPELEAISDFFATDVGQKYLASTPVLARELSKAARVWSSGVLRDFEKNVSKKLQEAAANK